MRGTMPASDLFAPSAYTAHLLLAARAQVKHKPPKQLLEIGVGSGVVIATLLQAGAHSAWGVDIEPRAVQAAQHLVADLQLGHRCRLEQGTLWSACQGQTFDLIVANLPHFASENTEDDAHLPSWSVGGADGRRWVDPFLDGLAEHLAHGGTALMTHNVFIGLQRTQERLANWGLQARVVLSASTPLAPSKLACMTPAVRSGCMGQSVHVVGPYAFVDFDILSIERLAEPAANGH
jgi:release factor glutamine methyltransferase